MTTSPTLDVGIGRGRAFSCFFLLIVLFVLSLLHNVESFKPLSYCDNHSFFVDSVCFLDNINKRTNTTDTPQLYQDLLQMFTEYQIPSDHMTFDGVKSTSSADKVANVKHHVVRSSANNSDEKAFWDSNW